MKPNRRAQFSFEGLPFRRQLAFGSSLLKNSNPKSKRPVSTRAPMHVVFRSAKAVGPLSMLHPRNKEAVRSIVYAEAGRARVRVIEFANVGNHCHLLVKAENRRLFLNFLRAATGRIAMRVARAKKGAPLAPSANDPDAKGRRAKFWDFRPFTRIVEGRRGYRVARDYVVLNQMEAAGLVPRRAGKARLETG